MLGLEIAVFAGLLGFHLYLSTLAHRKLLQNAMIIVSESIEELNMSLGEAIEMVQSNAASGQNPLVGVLSQVLMQNLEQPSIKAKVLQGEDGKFLKKE